MKLQRLWFHVATPFFVVSVRVLHHVAVRPHVVKVGEEVNKE